MNENLFNVVSALIVLICAVVGAYVVPYIKAKIGAERLDTLVYWANIAISAAEKIFDEVGVGEKKKEYVLDFLVDLMNKEKINITREQLNLLIESIVAEMNENK